MMQLLIFALCVIAVFVAYAFVTASPPLAAGEAGNNVQQSFFKTVFSLLGYVARRDGPVNKQEVSRTETYMKKMNLAPAQKREAIALFKYGASPGFNLHLVLREFDWLAKKSPNLAQILLVYLVNLARVDGLLVEEERTAVQKIARELGYNNITFEHLLKIISSQDQLTEEVAAEQPQPTYPSDCAYLALDLTPKASDAEVKRAYRKLVNQFHPDKLIGHGLPPFMVKALEERFKFIQAAYECIKESRA